MNQELINKINRLDNSQVVKLFNFVGEKLLEGLEEENFSNKIDPELKADKDLSRLMKLDEDVIMQNISSKQSTELSRKYLQYMAKDDYLSPILVKALEVYEEKQVLMSVDPALAVGFAASMVIFASTIEIKGKAFGIKFYKKAASPNLIKAIMEPFTKLLDKIKI